MSEQKEQKKGLLNTLERMGNKLPHPIYIFMIMAIIVVLVSALTSGTKVIHPGTGDEVIVRNLASKDGLVWILANVVNNFTKFPPLGMVLVMMIGLGLAEETGLLRTMLRKLIVGAPKVLVTFIVVFAGVMGSIAGSATFVVIPPLGGLVFKTLKRHPLAGIAAGFAGVAAGIGANLLITPGDILLSGITEQASHIIRPDFLVHPASNWYFMIVSTIVLSIVGTLVTEKIIEPRLGEYDPQYAEETDGMDEVSLMNITADEKKGLRNAGIATIVYLLLIALLVVPKNGILRHPETGSIVPSPFLSSMIPLLLVLFSVAAIAYGIGAKTIKHPNDIINQMTESMKSFAGFIVLCFFAAQFVEFFSYTNLGLLLAVEGADVLKSTGFVGIPLVVAFILVVSLINFLIGSSSAKWALLAPIFVPMFMQVNFSPAYTQAAFRIADSVTNSISPLEPFMPFIIVLAQRYDKRVGLGTIISTMIPHAFFFLISWIILLVIWALLNLPLGPGTMINLL